MCASKNPFLPYDRRCFACYDFMIFHEAFRARGNCIHDKWRDDIVAILDARPPQRGANFECGGKENAAKIRAAMSDPLDRCRARLSLVGFGSRETATLDVNEAARSLNR